ncbi:glycosyltransferase [Burkholderia sp. Ch1-1]|uniref:Glycosyltransferase n=1 Tax=Paraburkholderia dioscoreae TaxID=2604047 RepID=A0A5Q4ZK89_9BURK|nr:MULTISPECIES: glycosyltransferase family 4 protein [Paraburkholderia]EIF33311.1 glycosyltransferase [Burkholderia sp. Ch1-1]MDR8395918.1 glycosyltransferase family 4 protein [Paraburkholderia sp. USG1]VVD32147.1 Glycosyltransferase [Paraburkholderia dioscoreae]
MSKRQDDNPNLSHEAAPLRVLHVGPGQGQRGGIASVLAELGAQRARFRHAGVVVAIFETHGFQSMRSLLCFALVDIPRFLFAVLKGVDLIHFHVSVRGSFYRKFLLYLLARLFGKKTIFHLHAGNFQDFWASNGPTTRKAVSCFIRGADAVVAVSSAIASELQGHRGITHNLYVIGNTAYSAELAAGAALPESSDGKGADMTRYVAFAGRFTEGKGLDELLRAIAALNRQGLKVQLRLAGAGDTDRWTRAAIEYGVSDQVRFVGWLQGDAKLAFYRDAAVFCMPSHFEAFGISTLEAMFIGRPVIGTRVGGFFDLVEEGVTGYLVRCGDAHELAERIRHLMESPELARAMGRQAVSRALSRYSVDAIVSQYVRCYRQVSGFRGA